MVGLSAVFSGVKLLVSSSCDVGFVGLRRLGNFDGLLNGNWSFCQKLPYKLGCHLDGLESVIAKILHQSKHSFQVAQWEHDTDLVSLHSGKGWLLVQLRVVQGRVQVGLFQFVSNCMGSTVNFRYLHISSRSWTTSQVSAFSGNSCFSLIKILWSLNLSCQASRLILLMNLSMLSVVLSKVDLCQASCHSSSVCPKTQEHWQN